MNCNSHIKLRGLRPDSYSLQARKKANKKLEHNFQNNVIKELEMKGFIVIRHNSLATKTATGGFYRAYQIMNLELSSGLSDLQILKNGKTAFLEIKKDEKTKLSKNQAIVQKFFESYDIPYHRVGSYAELDAILKTF